MLQRVQSIWMVLAILAAVLFYFIFPHITVGGDYPIIEIAVALLVLLGGISIFSYKKRKRQILLNRFSIIINVLLISLLAYWLLSLSGGSELPEKGIELLFPVFSIVALFIANYKIRKDEKLVKSVDRFR